MNVHQVRQLIAAGKLDGLEEAWNQALQANQPVTELAGMLEVLVGAGQGSLAEMLGWTLLVQRTEQRPAEEGLELAKAFTAAVPDSQELRAETAGLYEQLFGQGEHFQDILKASGLLSGQGPRRAFRTLEVCLAIRPGAYLASRFDQRALRALQYHPDLEAFALADSAGQVERLHPRALADEFSCADENDFRVLAGHFPQRLKDLLESDPAGVLVGLCLARGGRIDSAALKQALVPQHLPPERWSGWWNAARNAAKRSGRLSLEGRNPVQVVYHASGFSLEEELAPAVAAAKMPLDHLAVLRQYVRQARPRKVAIDPGFTSPIVEALAEQARRFQSERPADALAAALAVEAAVGLGLSAPATPFPSPREVLASAAKPAEAVASLEEADLWPAALEALLDRADGAEQLRALLHLAPAGQLDQVARRLTDAGGQQAVEQAAAEALAAPTRHLEVLLWLWQDPSSPPATVPGKVDLLTRLLAALQEIDHDWNILPDRRKALRHRLRAALAQRDCACFRQAVGQMDLAVAGTIKSRIERCVGLAQAVRQDLLAILREDFYTLFAKAQVPPWLDERLLWTTEAALRRRQQALKELLEVKIPQNARDIGAAAEHGDLSENSEWKFALEERDLLQARAAAMQQELALARAIHPEEVAADSVCIGSRVHLERTSDGKRLELAFLGPWDSDVENGVYSYQTPLAAELMGKNVGALAQVRLPGWEGEYRIAALSSAVEQSQ